MKPYTRVYAPIDLDAAVFNMQSMQKNLSPGAKMLGVVKTDGYGHGAVPIAKAIAPYVCGYAVATVDEALNLRRHRIEKPILILGAAHPSCFQDLIDHDIRPAIFTEEQARQLSALAEGQGRRAKVHLAVDTGMSRIGLPPNEEGARIAAQIARMPGIEAEGLFTHFTRADEADKTAARIQMDRFFSFVDFLKVWGVEIPLLHISNSAAIIDLPQAHLTLVRAGISLYGLYPSDEVCRGAVALRPVMGLKSAITYIKEIPPGTEVSYGGTFRAQRKTRVATIPVGYGDGYPRGLSNRGQVLIHGKKAPILGRVCMDQFMADVTGIPEAHLDSEVTLLGRDGTEEITAEELARLSGRFHYELLCDIGKRVPRVYIQNGQIVGRKDYFVDIYEDFM